MNLSQLSDAEVASLIVGQMYQTYQRTHKLLSSRLEGSEPVGDSFDQILSDLRTDLTRIIDLIEEVGPR